MTDRIAYIPLNAYPEPPSDETILGAIRFARALGCKVQASTFAVEIPSVGSPLGGYLMNVEGMSRAAEVRSKAECDRLQTLLEKAGQAGGDLSVGQHVAVMGGAAALATTEARYFDLALVPWSVETVAAQDMAQSLVFGSGLPVVLVPPSVQAERVDHIAIAWDESRVAARALGDALRLLADGARITVLTVQDEKTLSGTGIAESLAGALQRRGYKAEAVNLGLGGQPIGKVLQDAAISAGAQLLAMGGFGHSRLRDFVLGGATKGILHDLRLQVLMSH